MRILVIEDNPRMAGAIQQGLNEQGFSVETVHTGIEGESRATDRHYDAILLDLMLPDRSGVEVCKTLRQRRIGTPILMLTALSGVPDRVAGLNAGADDYLGKPFDLEELSARLRALVRRGQAPEPATLRYDDLELDPMKRKVRREGRSLKISAKEFTLLEFLVRNAGRVLTRPVIAREIWEMEYDPGSNLIDVYISNLRKKIDKGYERPLIHTVIGTGYRFGAPL